MRTINFEHLKRLAIFVTVVEQGSFVAAANQLGLGRSSASEQVALLESVLGFRLLHRTTRQISLTGEGTMVYDRARVLPAIVNEVSQLTVQDVPRGRVRITTTHDFAEKWLIPRLRSFRKLHPDIYYDLVLNDSPIDLVAGNIDLAIRIGRPRDAALVARPIRLEAPQIIASREYIKACGAPKNVKALAQHTWILISQLNIANRVTLTAKKDTVEFVPNNYHICNSPLAARVMIESGMGIGLHLPSMVEAQIKSKSLHVLMPEWREEPLTYSVIYPSRHNIPLRTRLLIDFLIEV